MALPKDNLVCLCFGAEDANGLLLAGFVKVFGSGALLSGTVIVSIVDGFAGAGETVA